MLSDLRDALVKIMRECETRSCTWGDTENSYRNMQRMSYVLLKSLGMGQRGEKLPAPFDAAGMGQEIADDNMDLCAAEAGEKVAGGLQRAYELGQMQAASESYRLAAVLLIALEDGGVSRATKSALRGVLGVGEVACSDCEREVPEDQIIRVSGEPLRCSECHTTHITTPVEEEEPPPVKEEAPKKEEPAGEQVVTPTKAKVLP